MIEINHIVMIAFFISIFTSVSIVYLKHKIDNSNFSLEKKIERLEHLQIINGVIGKLIVIMLIIFLINTVMMAMS